MNKDVDIDAVRSTLLQRFDDLDVKSDILKAPELKELFANIRSVSEDDRAAYGQGVNALRKELESMVAKKANQADALAPIDVTAPMDVNAQPPSLLSALDGSQHPVTKEIAALSAIFERMGYVVEESREIDDQYHMFESLNFPADHPARDEYDTFVVEQTDSNGDKLIAPAHTSTMQNRILQKYKPLLETGQPIAAVIPDRVFRNEDLDARHEHTFYQVEGVYVGREVHVGMLIATLQQFLESYYGKKLDVRLNPFYFPFTEPSLEFALSCPFCEAKDQRCKVCSGEGWIELLGCGMIHPNVLKMAGIDPAVYTGFAFGCGIDRLIMMKHGIEDVRHFHSGKLDFLRQF